MKEVLEPVTKSIKYVSGEVTKTITETFLKYNQALENLSNPFFEIMKDRDTIASYLLSPLLTIRRKLLRKSK